MRFRKGLKIQIDDENSWQTDIRPAEDIDTRFISLTTGGLLTQKPGYACDGCSGPTIDQPRKFFPKWLNRQIMKVLPG